MSEISQDTSGLTDLRLSPADISQVDEITAWFSDVLPGEAVTQLGEELLKLQIEFYIKQPRGICLAVTEEHTGRVGGVVIGGEPSLRKMFVRQNAFRIARQFLIKALTQSVVRKRIGQMACSAFFKLPFLSRWQKKLIPAPPDCPWAFLLWIGTRSDFRCRGVARMLLRGFQRQSSILGFQKIRLTVQKVNAPAIALYERTGWTRVGSSDCLYYFEKEVAPTYSEP